MRMKQALIVLSLAGVVLLSVFTFLSPQISYSDEQNRTLAHSPEFSLQKWMNGDFSQDTEDFLQDQLILRERFTKMATGMELLAGNREIGGVYIGNSRLIGNTEVPDEKITQSNAAAISAFAEKYSGSLETSLMLVPTAQEFYASEIPLFAEPFDQTAYIQKVYQAVEGAACVDAYTSLAASPRDIFYRTDYRWTSYGAYVGYTALAKTLGFKAVSHDMFNVEHVSHDFLGNLYARTLYGEQWEDSIDLYTFAPHSVVQDVVKNTGVNTETYSSIFFRDELEGRDAGDVFLGESYPLVTIRTSVGNGKKLILFRDSYADTMMQFLPLHYDEIVLVDLRHLNRPLSEYINLADYQQALFLYNVEDFTDDASISKVLRY